MLDSRGNLYGTTSNGGTQGAGTVFQLTPMEGGAWSETVLYNFCSQPNCANGAGPDAGLISDKAGNLYGTNSNCGSAVAGNVFELSPPAVPGGAWTETVLYTFGGIKGNDGCFPVGKLVFDASGNLYGTTSGCGAGANPDGSVFELTPSGDGTWEETILYSFTCEKSGQGCLRGSSPQAAVTFDKAGNLYGTTRQGGGHFAGGGVVYKLSPGAKGWTQAVLFDFTTTGEHHGGGPMGDVNFDAVGNLYSTVSSGGQFGFGGVFRLKLSNGGKEVTLSLSGAMSEPMAGLLIDPRNGNLYGTAQGSGLDNGSVFKIVGKNATALYSFTGGTDGGRPVASLIANKKGHLYGTTQAGGDFNHGVVFEIIP